MAASEKRVRVLHVITMLQSGGVERWTVDICEAGRREGLDMDIAAIEKNNGIFADVARERGIPVYHIEAGSSPLTFISNLRRLLREKGPYDALHCHMHAFSAFAMIAGRQEGVPVRIAHSHNVMANASSKSPVRRAYAVAARTLIGWFANAGLAPSSSAGQDLFGPTWQRDPRWRVLPYGFDLARFYGPIGAESTREALGIPGGAFVLGSVGRLNPEKNSEFLVDVLGSVLKVRNDAYLLLVGEGALREKLEHKAAAGGYRDRLVLPGARKDVPALLRNVVDVFVFPSPPPPRGNEALAIAVLEAQAAGLPCVISDGIPAEARIVPDLTIQIPAALSADDWAQTALQQAPLKNPENAARARAVIEGSGYNSATTVRTLAALYRNGRG